MGFLNAAAADLGAVLVAGLFGVGAGSAFCCGLGAGGGNALGCEGAGARYMGWLKALLPPVTLLLRPRGLLAVPTLDPGALV